MAKWSEAGWKTSWWEKGGRKGYITERNGRSSWERQAIIAFCTCQWNEWNECVFHIQYTTVSPHPLHRVGIKIWQLSTQAIHQHSTGSTYWSTFLTLCQIEPFICSTCKSTYWVVECLDVRQLRTYCAINVEGWATGTLQHCGTDCTTDTENDKHLTFPLSYTITTGRGGWTYQCTTDTDLRTRRERRGRERERGRQWEKVNQPLQTPNHGSKEQKRSSHMKALKSWKVVRG